MSTPTFRPEQYAERDQAYWAHLDQLSDSRSDMARNFPSYVRRRELAKFLAHYELFKQVADLPGSVVELGVFKGASFFTWAKLLETLCPGDRGRKVYGFDSFEGLQHFDAEDGALGTPLAQSVQREAGAYRTAAQPLRDRVHWCNQDNLLAGHARCVLVEGDVQLTLPGFLERHEGLRLCLIHLDLDLFAPTLFALERLWPLLVTGGLVVLDEYGITGWQGESRAIEVFFQRQGRPVPTIRKLPISDQPGGYLVK